MIAVAIVCGAIATAVYTQIALASYFALQQMNANDPILPYLSGVIYCGGATAVSVIKHMVHVYGCKFRPLRPGPLCRYSVGTVLKLIAAFLCIICNRSLSLA